MTVFKPPLPLEMHEFEVLLERTIPAIVRSIVSILQAQGFVDMDSTELITPIKDACKVLIHQNFDNLGSLGNPAAARRINRMQTQTTEEHPRKQDDTNDSSKSPTFTSPESGPEVPSLLHMNDWEETDVPSYR
jgi:hypothetical protein